MMIRFVISLCISLGFLSLNAQQTYSVFIDQSIMDWHESAIHEYQKSVENLSSDNRQVQQKAKQQIKSFIKIFNQNSASLLFQMEQFLDANKIKELSKVVMTDGAKYSELEQRNIKLRTLGKFSELKMSFADLDEYSQIVSEIKDASDSIVANDYNNLATLKTRTESNGIISFSALTVKSNEFLMGRILDL